MVDNQHNLIKGYRDLTLDQISEINDVKNIGEIINTLVTTLENHPTTDKRWVAIGKTNLQQGMMALVRSVAKPDFF